MSERSRRAKPQGQRDAASRAVVVVLGMHRSGTSALAAGVQALGVELGDRLIEPGPDENPKGFFEDAAVLDLSERLLASLGRRWSSLAAPADAWWETDESEAFAVEACELLRERFADAPLFGFKDPRAARLLPFWERVFARLGVEPHYLVAVRHPLSVARSLEQRNGFDAARSHLLWLVHTSEAVNHTAGRSRLFADYDALVADANREMRRVADWLGVHIDRSRSQALRAYAKRFIETELRHTHFDAGDLPLDPQASALVVRAFEWMGKLSTDEIDPNDGKLRRAFREIRSAVGAMRPLLERMDRLDADLEARDRALAATEKQSQATRQELLAAEERMEATRHELRAAEERSDQALRELGEKERTLGEARERDAAALAEARQSFEIERSERVRLGGELERLAGELTETHEQIGRLGAMERQFGDERRRLSEALEQAGETQRQLEDEVTRQSSRRQELEMETTRAGVVRETLEARVQELDARLREVDDHRVELGQSLGAARERLEERERALDEVAQRVAGLQERLETEGKGAQERIRSELALGRTLRDTRRQLDVERIERRSEREATRERIEALEREVETERSAVEDQVRRAFGLERSLRDTRKTLDLERTRGAGREAEQLATAWRLRSAIASRVDDLVQSVQALRTTRTWRWTRTLQRGADRVRLRDGSDAVDWLEAEVAQLRELVSDLPDQCVAARGQLDGVRDLFDGLRTGELHRIARWAATSSNAVRGRTPEPGPIERIDALIDELALAFLHFPVETGDAAARMPTWRAPDATVDVVVPVHSDLETTLRCLESVFASANLTPYELVVVDDSGADGEISRTLRELADEGRFTLIANPTNLGFVRSANAGMSLHEDRDVVLLNSDTLVHGNWLDRLRAAAHRDWMVASATPWSNNAEICSIPQTCFANPAPDEAEVAVIDRRCAEALPRETPTIPTCVGFCTYIRRDALRDVGLFDAERFGKGYGEENDFSMRARGRGWRHVLAADTYVAHVGGVSFGASKQKRVEEALRTLDSLHPRYRPEVHAFVDGDPLQPLRRRIDLAELASDLPVVLLVTPSMGGGTRRHVEELADGWAEEGVDALLLEADSERPGERVWLRRAGCERLANLSFDLPAQWDALVEILGALDLRLVHLHHTLQFPVEIGRLGPALGVPYDFTVHDYFPICPRVHLVDASQSYCGEPEDVSVCEACVRKENSPVGREVDMVAWREGYGRLLEGARSVYVPSADAAKRLGRYFPAVEFLVRPHWDGGVETAPAEAPPGDGVVRVAVVGAIGDHKGSQVLLACARDAELRRLPLEFRLVGYSNVDSELARLSRVQVTGRYEDSELFDLLAEQGCDRAFLPSVWPETFCYTLSAVLRGRLFPIGFELGAVGDRIRELDYGEVLPLGLAASEINDRLLALEPGAFPEERVASALGTRPALGRAYYELRV